MEGQTPGEGRLMQAGWAQERRLSIVSQPIHLDVHGCKAERPT